MKNLFCLFLVVLISNTSFSQEKTEKDITEEDNTNDLFKFYPNPAENELFILGKNKIKSIEIIDVLGKTVATHLIDKSIIKIDVSQLKSGVYLLQVTNENDTLETKRLVIK
ncbi:T9SS type A sorting domain-containing protein [Flavivirga eckloniae]|uniref:Secretion system C-terminal sorting domain-containing protein n=1 Tax=Flavivirga eckloniae TaxID=1803846 RepID=A0A2K9PQF0_9FLAO|nr:T9SS type A sorting domain-containing protein [Flavivirga eckloniae]AUP79269.1 hypothetical protein C1H87_11365 [Flavivirga eckloniae]